MLINIFEPTGEYQYFNQDSIWKEYWRKGWDNISIPSLVPGSFQHDAWQAGKTAKEEHDQLMILHANS